MFSRGGMPTPLGVKDMEPLRVKFYAIEVDGRALQGWVHVVVTSEHSRFGILQLTGSVDYVIDKRSSTEPMWDYNSVEVHRSGSGEFVYDFPTCDEDKDPVTPITPVKYQFMPCGGVPARQQTVINYL